MEAVPFAYMTLRWAFPLSALTDLDKYLFKYKFLIFRQKRE